MSSLKRFKIRQHSVCFFVDDIVLINETRDGVNEKLEWWRDNYFCQIICEYIKINPHERSYLHR